MRQAFLCAVSMAALLGAAVTSAGAGPFAMAHIAGTTESGRSDIANVGWSKRRYFPLNSYEDPYRYHYEPRGYYPYYNSGYWVPRELIHRNYDFAQPPYAQAWGDNVPGYKNREWHRENHGRIAPWHY